MSSENSDSKASSSSSTISSVSAVSRLITEEDLIDTLFSACDFDKEGSVPASRIIDYIQHTTNRSSPSDRGCSHRIERLKEMLGAETEDCRVNLETSRSSLRQWINEIRLEDFSDQGVDDDNSMQIDALVDDVFNPHSSHSLDVPETLDVNIRTSSDVEIPTSLAKLELKNKKLKSENDRLLLQLESNEETNNSLNMELVKYQEQLKELLSVQERSETTAKENDDLKLLLQNVEDSRLALENDLLNAQKKNAELTKKLKNAAAEIELLKDEKDALYISLQDQKALQSESETITSDLASELKQKSEMLSDLQDLISTWISEKEELRKEKTDLDVKLLHKENELHEVRCEQVRGDEELLCSTNEEVEEVVPPQMLPLTPNFKTSSMIVSVPSICNEIKTSMPQGASQDEYLPSPICKKEHDFIFGSLSMQDNQDESSIAESPELPISTLNLPENLKIRLRQQVLELSNALAAISIEKENMQRRIDFVANEMQDLEESKLQAERSYEARIAHLNEIHQQEKNALQAQIEELQNNNIAEPQFESKTEQDFELMEEGVTHQDQLTAHMVQLQNSNVELSEKCIMLEEMLNIKCIETLNESVKHSDQGAQTELLHDLNQNVTCTEVKNVELGELRQSMRLLVFLMAVVAVLHLFLLFVTSIPCL